MSEAQPKEPKKETKDTPKVGSTSFTIVKKEKREPPPKREIPWIYITPVFGASLIPMGTFYCTKLRRK
jgi:hypothetical protein